MIKIYSKLGIKENFFNLVRGFQQKAKRNTIANGKTLPF